MRKKSLWAAILAGFILLIAGCGEGSGPLPGPSLEIAPPQNPYQAITRAPDQPTPTIAIPTEQPLLPTATPLVHSVQPGDTLFGLALQYNISVDELVLANPGVDTSILSIGMELKVPPSREEDLTVPTPTPYPVPMGEPVCYPAQAGGTWCFSMVENKQDLVLENIAAAFNIYDQSRQFYQSFAAIPPLDYLFPDQSLPLAVFIEAELPDPFQVSVVLLTALASDLKDASSRVAGQQYHYREENRIAEISGLVEITDALVDPDEIWVAAIGYNQGTPVGIRKWVSPSDLAISQDTPFELVLYSLGPPIDRIQLLSELH